MEKQVGNHTKSGVKMANKIKHTWIPSPRYEKGKISHKMCIRCKCEKYYSMEIQRTVYLDRFGRLLYRAPSCVLPNTKL